MTHLVHRSPVAPMSARVLRAVLGAALLALVVALAIAVTDGDRPAPAAPSSVAATAVSEPYVASPATDLRFQMPGSSLAGTARR